MFIMDRLLQKNRFITLLKAAIEHVQGKAWIITKTLNHRILMRTTGHYRYLHSSLQSFIWAHASPMKCKGKNTQKANRVIQMISAI